jgi:hypothetical protein
MNKCSKIFSGILALTVGLGLAMPMRVTANDSNSDRDHHQTWRWERENDHYRAYPDAPGQVVRPGQVYGNQPGYAYGNRPLPANGQGMINDRNPNLYWACDSDGHHCHWARR